MQKKLKTCKLHFKNQKYINVSAKTVLFYVKYIWFQIHIVFVILDDRFGKSVRFPRLHNVGIIISREFRCFGPVRIRKVYVEQTEFRPAIKITSTLKYLFLIRPSFFVTCIRRAIPCYPLKSRWCKL